MTSRLSSPTTTQASEMEAQCEEKQPTTPSSGDLNQDHPKTSKISPPTLAPAQDEWATGFKLFTIMTAVTLVALLMLLDTSIVVTVSLKKRRGLHFILLMLNHRQFHVSRANSILFPM